MVSWSGGAFAERQVVPKRYEDVARKWPGVNAGAGRELESIFDTFYIKEGKLIIYKEHYFEFPHVIQSLDTQISIQFTFDELEKYLKSESILFALKD